MINNLWLFRNLLFVVKLGKSISDSLWENKKKFIFSFYDLGYSCYFGQLENIQWVIMVEYEEKHTGSLVLSLLIKGVKWSYEVESKFDIERNFAFKIVTLNSLLDCRNVVVSLWLSVILLLLWVSLQWCFSINGSFMYFEVHTFPQNSISFDVQIMCAVSGLIDIMTKSFSSL